jgi:ABC-type glycerol-3-phosphate transport system substrate-binding protein
MQRLKAALLATALTVLPPVLAAADCAVEGSGEVNVLSNSFPAFEAISKAVEECNKDGVKVTFKQTREHEQEHSIFAGASSPYDMAGVANTSIAPLQGEGLLLPLNDLVDKYGPKYGLEESMKIKFGDDILAIAFMVNSQHLFYRKDLFEKHGLKVPTNYEEVLAAAEVLKGNDSIEFPLGGTYKSGWNLAEEFTNMYLGMGGEFFKPGTAEPAFNNETGVKALELMKRLTEYMSPNALALDTTAVLQQFQQGQIAMANFWASRAAAMDDPAESKVAGKIGFAAAPAAVAGGPPATTIWWDGFVIPKNLDGDPDLTFQVMMEGLDGEMVKANNDAAIWLRSSYQMTPYAEGTAASAEGGAPSYPMSPQQSIAHGVIGNNIGDYFAGKESAEQALADAEAAYIQAAKEGGLLN